MAQLKQEYNIVASVVALLNIVNSKLNDAISNNDEKLIEQYQIQRQELLNKLINSNFYDFTTAAIGIDRTGNLALLLSSNDNNDFSHATSFLRIIHQLNMKLSEDQESEYCRIIKENPALLAAKCFEIANSASAVGLTIMQAFSGYLITYLPNELTQAQRQEIEFLVNNYNKLLMNDNPKPFSVVCNDEYSSEMNRTELAGYLSSIPAEQKESHVIK